MRSESRGKLDSQPECRCAQRAGWRYIVGLLLPIQPGSSDGIYSLAYVAVQVAPDTPVGTYIVSLWVNDGTRRQAVPVTLIVADSCSDY